MSDLPVKTDADPGQKAQIIYILFLASIVFGPLSIIGVIMAFVFRSDAEEWVKSHYDWQIRTFFIGFAAAIIGMFLTLLLIGWLVLLALFIWWVVRAVQGIQKLSRKEAIPDVKSLLFA